MTNDHDLAPLIEGTPEMAWLQDASCGELGLDQLDLFFVEAGRTLSKEAAAICRACPAKVDCLTHAFTNEIEGGYFGGVSSAKRRTLTLDQAIELIDV